MASNTENLNLLMKNPSTDGADTFNVQTMLNENWQKIDKNAGAVAQTLANILKPTTPPIIGLPPSTTPDGMFQALGNTGELHVWRKTVFEPAGYRLGTPENGFIVSASAYNSGNAHVSFTTSDTISVDSKGSATQDNPSGDQFFVIAPGNVATIQAKIRGKFVTEKVTAESGYYIDHPGLVYIPDDAILSCITNGTSLGYPYDYCYVVDRMQRVQPYPVNPVVTYPVSTNPNAYQEGDDAKEAGYVVGEEKNITINGMNGPILLTGNSLTVADDGTLSITSPAQYGVYNSSTTEDVRSVVAGKYIYIPYNSGSVGFFKVPSNVLVTGSTAPEGGSVFTFTAQPVTGYAAIQAGTTIEYLGKLGDKARVQVVSYVGTGTYGKDNPNSLTFDFVPKVALYLGASKDNGSTQSSTTKRAMFQNELTINYISGFGFSLDTSNYPSYGKRSADGKTFYWYTTGAPRHQLNESSYIYYFLALA